VVTRRHTVGAHYGLRDWLAQRLTALVMAAYTLLLLGVALWNGGIDHSLWTALFGNGAFRLASFVFMVALAWHAWVGMRNIFMDYVKPVAVRLTLQALTIGVLVAYLGWTIQILWGVRP
jgi:succinate dehydrogenase / fumarate reductase membrane anchor subunit